MYGFEPVGSYIGIPSVRKEFTNSAAALAQGDVLSLESGVLTVASTGDWIVGISDTAQDASATGCGVNVTPWLTGYMDNDNDSTTFASTHVGYRFNVTGTTGAMVVDTSTADNSAGAPVGQLVAVEYNPAKYSSDTSVGLFLIVEHQLFGASSA